MKSFVKLKLITRTVCMIALLLCCYHAVAYISSVIYSNQVDLPNKLRGSALQITHTCLIIMGLFVAFKAKEDKGRYLFALFIAGYVLSSKWFFSFIDSPLLRSFAFNFESVLAGALFICSMQYFPAKITNSEVNEVLKNKVLRRYLVWLLKPLNIWVYYLLFLLLIANLYDFIHLSQFTFNLAIILTGFCYMYINYKKSGINSRNSILWLFWGVLSYVILLIFLACIHAFNTTVNPYINTFIAVLLDFVLLIMVFMSVFFANSFDTGFIIKRTIVDGILFLLVILIYNVVEHYLLHIINEHLEINDAFLSSLLSGVMVLLISPLHHRLNHYLNNKLKPERTPQNTTH